MNITKLSTKGQIVIPEKLREGISEGEHFAIEKIGSMFVLKPVLGLSKEEKTEFKEIDQAWKDIASGKAEKYSENEFFSALKEW